jgi:Rrf2 family protein
MRLTRKVIYALHATLLLANTESNRPVPCSELAKCGQMPGRWLLHILRILVRARILRSTRGTAGGYRLSRPPNQIRLLDILDATDDFFIPAELEMPGISPQIKERALSSFDHASAAARKQLEKLTLSDLMQTEPGLKRTGLDVGDELGVIAFLFHGGSRNGQTVRSDKPVLGINEAHIFWKMTCEGKVGQLFEVSTQTKPRRYDTYEVSDTLETDRKITVTCRHVTS